MESYGVPKQTPAAAHENVSREASTPQTGRDLSEINEAVKHLTHSYLPSSIVGPSVSSFQIPTRMSEYQQHSEIGTGNAVLSALSALQDKIRKLESDKSQIESHCATLQHQLSTAKEMHRLLEKEHQHRLEESTRDRDQLLTTLAGQRDHIQNQDREITQLKERSLTLETEKRGLEEQVRELQRQLHAIASRAAQDRKTIEQRLTDYERDSQQLVARLSSLDAQLQEERETRNAAEIARRKAEEKLAELVELNQDLVAKLTKAEKKKSKKGSVASTVSSTAKRTTSVAKTRPASASVSASFSQTKRGERDSEIRTSLKAAHDGKSIPFILGKSSGLSHSTVATVQRFVGAGKRDPTPTSARGPLEALTQVMTSAREHANEHAHQRSRSREHREHDTSHVSASFTAPAAPPSTPQAPGHEDLLEADRLVRSLEREFDQLQNQYQMVLAQIQADSYDSAQDVYLNSKLRDTIHALERKGQQLDSLRRYHKAIQQRLARLSPVTPASADKRLQALQMLQSMREVSGPHA